ncbi:MAG TPA: DegT/DnrJ/EryC1/StrS family aminotransferase [Armatimonadetes bacterium]|jgi:perosamine synthetase|nr:DegT/DnrJ/EryC1/StrS family aminotransferase [Armatimonadota bacterium]
MEKALRKEILQTRRLSRNWPAEPLLGGYYTDEEIDTVVKTIRESMDPTVGFGFICKEITDFEAAFAAYCGTADAVSINGAGSGLDMTLMAMDLQPEDEVIVPTLNFRAGLVAVLGQNARLVVCDVDPVTLQADPNDVERRITPRTRAICPVHMNGLSAPIDDYLEIAERHPHPKYGPPKVIGDAARALGGGYKGTKIGKKGWMTVFSFHTQKNMTTLGEGGAITTDDLEAAKRLRALRQFGGSDGWGSNYKMTKVQAAVGLVQLRKLDSFIAARRKVAQERTEMLKDVEGLTLPVEPPDCYHTYYLYTCLVPKEWAGEKRDRLMAMLREEYGVNTVVANPPVHRVVPFVAKHTQGQETPVADELGARLFCPPTHPLMTREENEYICAAIADAMERIREGA